MPKRLNLSKFHCQQLSIVFHVKLPPDVGDRVLAGSHGHEEDGRRYYALYGNLYSLAKVPHVVRATIQRVEDEFHVELDYLQEEWSKPPRSVKPFGNLQGVLLQESQAVTFECSACFSYDSKSGWASALEMPLPLTDLPDESPFSHLEGITLSKRQEDKIRYSVQVGRTPGGDLRHVVSLIWEGELTENAPKESLEGTAKLSRMLLRRAT